MDAHDDLPEIEVDIEGSWRPGLLRAWDPRQDGLWADITYQIGSGEYRDRMLPAEQVRPPGHPEAS
jgi:hypothetical protein